MWRVLDRERPKIQRIEALDDSMRGLAWLRHWHQKKVKRCRQSGFSFHRWSRPSRSEQCVFDRPTLDCTLWHAIVISRPLAGNSQTMTGNRVASPVI